MKLLVLFGNAAVDKMAVGQELMKVRCPLCVLSPPHFSGC